MIDKPDKNITEVNFFLLKYLWQTQRLLLPSRYID